MNVTFLYYVRFYNSKINLYKIGVSKNVYKRVSDICPKGFKIQLLMMEDFDCSKEAYEAELLIKRLFRKELSTKNFGLPETETFNRDVLMKDLKSEFTTVYKDGKGYVKVLSRDVDFSG